MAKKKKVVKKKAAEKKVAKKKKVVKKKTSEKKAESAPKITAVTTQTETANIMTVDLSKFGYEIPKGLKAQQRMLAAKIDAGDDAEKHSAIILSQMKQEEVHLRHNCATFNDFCDSHLNMPVGTVSNAVKLVEKFTAMGIAPKIFKKITPSHVHIIYKGFEEGAISGKTLEKFVADSIPGKDYKNRAKLKMAVNKALGIEAGKTGKKTKNYVLHPETGEAQEIIESCLGILKEHPIYGDYSASQLFEKSLQEFTANHSKDAKPSFLSADAALNMLAGFLPKSIVPILVVADAEALNELPAELRKLADRRLVSSVFAAFKAYKKVEVLATTKVRAAKIMKVDEDQVRETPIEVDKALIPKTSGRFFETEAVEATTAAPVLTAEELLALDDDELKKAANLMGFKVGARMSRTKVLMMLLTDADTFGLSNEEAKDLVAPPKKAAPKKKAAKKKKAAPKEEEESEEEESEEEESEEEPKEGFLDGLMESEEEEETEAQVRDASKNNLALLKGEGHISQSDLAKKIKEINEETPDISGFERLQAVRSWSVSLCKKHGLECK